MDLHEGNTKAYRSWGSGVTDGIQDCRAGVQDGREWQERRARYKRAKKAHNGVRGERGGEERGGEKGERGGGREVKRIEMVVVKKKGARRVKCQRRARLCYADVSEEYYSARQPARYLPGGHCHRVYFIKFVTSS